MLLHSRLFLCATLVALALGGCDCGTDPGTNGNGNGGDGGDANANGNGNGNGSSDGGDANGNGNGSSDGGDANGNGNGSDAGDAGGNTSVCLTIQEACAPGGVPRCGFVSDGCNSGYQCDGAAGVQAGGTACTGTQICQNNTCTTPTLPDGGMPTTCPSPTTNTAARCAALNPLQTPAPNCGEWIDAAGCPVDCWPDASHTCPNAGEACAQVGGTGPFACRSTSGSTCTGTHCNDGSLPGSCSGNPTATQLSGTVRTPGRDHDNNGGTANINQVPVPNAIVYIPATNGAVPAIATGITPNNPLSCGRCADEQWTTGGVSVLASAVTDFAGRFTLTGQIPSGDFDLVIKTGKWRRVVRIPAGSVTACNAANTITTAQGLLPSVGSADGLNHLPHIAVSTGDVDEMECVFRNIGIAENQFTRPSVTTTETAGRIHLYVGNGGVPSGSCGAGFDCTRTGLYGTPGTPATNRLNEYDMVVMDCEGSETQHDAQEPNFVTYVDNGGRLFASHFSYTWIENNGTLDQSADWGTGGSIGTGTGFISMPATSTVGNIRTGANTVKSLVFRDFLDYMGALASTTAGLPLENPNMPSFTITDPRDRAGSNVGASTDEWVFRNARYCSNNASRACASNNDCQNGGTCNASTLPRVQQLSFNTPYGSSATAQCGRVAFSGFHVSGANNDAGPTFPYCSNSALTAQELVLVYMLFDLNACVSTGEVTPPSTCTPVSKESVCGLTPGVTCGQFSDGCGGIINCDPCNAGEFCNVHTCTASTCAPTTCDTLGYECGQFSDGCGGIADRVSPSSTDSCGTCAGGLSCLNGMCVSQCIPVDPCIGFNCGTRTDNCGNVVNCDPGNSCAGFICTANVCQIE